MKPALLLLIAASTACESKIDKALDEVGDKVKNNTVVQKVDKGLDKLDSDEISDHLTKAKELIGKGEEPMEACSWAGRNEGKSSELDRLCKLDVPLMRATKAVTAAEKAKAEQPQAPSLTECSSDEWAQTRTKLEGSAFASDAKWADLKARWAKVCPDAK